MSAPAAHRLRAWMFPEHGHPAPGEAIVVGPTARAVLVALWLHANGAGVTWVSAPTIAVGLELDEKTVRTAFQRLERAGLIAGERRPGKSTVWTLTPDTAPGVRLTEPRAYPGRSRRGSRKNYNPQLQPPVAAAGLQGRGDGAVIDLTDRAARKRAVS